VVEKELAMPRNSILLTTVVALAWPLEDDSSAKKARQQGEQLQEMAAPKPGPAKKFDAVIWKKGEQNQISLLYVILERPKVEFAKKLEYVAEYAAQALVEAKKYKTEKFNVVFFFPAEKGSKVGHHSGFSIEELGDIVEATPERARQLVGLHAWAFGKLREANTRAMVADGHQRPATISTLSLSGTRER
jgi:hypothetical protein